MKFDEIRDLTSEELRKRVTKMREEMFEARMKHSMGQIGNPIELRNQRRDLARVMTALNMKLRTK